MPTDNNIPEDEIAVINTLDDSDPEPTKDEVVEETKPTETAKRYTPYKEVTNPKDIATPTLGIPTMRADGHEIIQAYERMVANLSGKEGAEESDKIKGMLADMTIIYEGMVDSIYAEKELNNVADKEELSQLITSDKGARISMGHPVIKAEDGEVLQGKQALRFISKFTGVGDTTKVPLWASGITVELDAFRETALLDLNIKLSKRRAELGYSTRGASYTGDDVYVIGVIIEFILEHVVKSSVKNMTVKLLKKLILVSDIPTLLAGALATMYPTGYPFMHVCTALKGECDHVSAVERKDNNDYVPEGMLDFTKVSWVDRDKLPDNASTFMGVDYNSHTSAQVLEYQEKIKSNMDNDLYNVWQSDGKTLDIRFKHPSIADYMTMCGAWVDKVTSMVDKALEVDTDLAGDELESKRVSLIADYVRALNLQKHINWVEYIRITDADGDEVVINDTTTIAEVLQVFSETDGFTTKFTTEAQRYKNNSTITMAGIPNHECPSCGQGQVPEGAKYPTLIPLNMCGFFFIIMELRLITRNG